MWLWASAAEKELAAAQERVLAAEVEVHSAGGSAEGELLSLPSSPRHSRRAETYSEAETCSGLWARARLGLPRQGWLRRLGWVSMLASVDVGCAATPPSQEWPCSISASTSIFISHARSAGRADSATFAFSLAFFG